MCPLGWFRNFPEKILLDCRYGHTASFPLSEGWQGTQRNLIDLQVGADKVSLTCTPVSQGASRASIICQALGSVTGQMETPEVCGYDP